MADAPEVVDGQVVEENGQQDHASVEIVPAPPPSRAEVLQPLDLTEVKGAMEKYQLGLSQLLDPTDWQGPPNQDGSFVKKSGWRKIATWFSLSVNLLPGTEVKQRDEDGQLLRCSVWARATAPNGRSSDGDGHCSLSEPRFEDEKGRLKVEHDMPATAATRAKNRAIADLVGMGAVSAEEVDATGNYQDSRNGFASDKQRGFMERLLKEAGASQGTASLVLAYCNATMEGGRGKGISNAIDSLKGDGREAGEKLAADAKEWERSQSDLPADEEGLPEVDAEPQETLDA